MGLTTSDTFFDPQPAEKPKEEMKHHPTHPPSSFPAMKACACYKPDNKGSRAADRGTELHEQLAAILESREWDGAEPEVKWAAERVLESAPGQHDIAVETKVVVKRGAADLTFGHADAYCDGHLFDLKTGQHKRDYSPQMAVYGLGMMQKHNLPSITVHLLYSAFREVESYTITREEAEAEVFGIVDATENPTKEAAPCSYCSWCANKESCTALSGLATTVSDGLMDLPKSMDLGKVSDPAEMGKFKAIADHLKVWIEAVNAKAKEFDDIDGYHKVTRKGTKSLTDAWDTMSELDISVFELMSCCSISYPKLVNKFSELKNISKEQAEEKLSVLLSAQIKEGHETKYWRKK